MSTPAGFFPRLLAAALALAVLPAAGLAAARPGAHGAHVPAHARVRAVTPNASAAAPAAAEAPDTWHAARTLADANRFDDALALLHSALAAHPDDYALRWLEAGITAEAGRHRESLSLYRKLSTDHPDRADELLADLAAERLWDGDAAGAASDFRRWLAVHPGDDEARRRLALALSQADSLRPALAQYDIVLAREPGDIGMALERARVLAWLGRNDDAIVAYRAVLQREPDNAIAQLGVAMNDNWAGRHRSATRQLERITGGPSMDPEAEKALAFARYWDADPAGARTAIDAYLVSKPRDAEGLELSRQLKRERGPSLRFEAGRADDSDGLRINSTGMELRWPMASATIATLRWHRDNLRDAGGTRDPLQLTAGLQHFLGPQWSVHGELTHVDWGQDAGNPQGGEAGIVSRPGDHVRLEAAVAREPVMTRQALAFGISRLDWIGAADLMFGEVVSLHADGRAGYYSDQNGQERLGGSLRWKAFANRRTELGLSVAAEQLEVHFDPGHGYYAPAMHREWGPGADATWQPQDRWSLGAASQFGWQSDRFGDTQPFYSLTGRTEYVSSGAWSFDLEGGRSDSSLQNDAGYTRTWWTAGLTWGF